MKKIIFISLIVCVVLGFLTWKLLRKNTAAPVVTDALSPRAQEFIADQKSDGVGLWNQVDLEKNASANSTSTFVSTECFSIELPFRSSNAVQSFENNRCTWRAKSITPLSYLAIANYALANFESDTGILLRRKDTDRYTETALTTQNFDKAIMFRSATELVAFAYQNLRMTTLSFTEISQPDKITDEQITQLLNALQLKPTE